MKKVLLVHPDLNVHGGAEHVALSILRWFFANTSYQITILSLEAIKKETIELRLANHFNSTRYQNLLAYCPRYLLRNRGKYELLRLLFLHRKARAIAKFYDICISSCGEMDFGKMGIQYIHYPVYAPRKLRKMYNMVHDYGILERIPGVLLVYEFLLPLFAGFTVEGFRRNISLANSRFISSLLEMVYSINATVAYPIISAGVSSQNMMPWQDRHLSFITIGRIAHDKNYEELLIIYKDLYHRYPLATFTIVGNLMDMSCYSYIQQQKKLYNLPLKIYTDVNDEEVKTMLHRCRFYIHAKRYEHFGISIVEAIEAGCVPFVHKSGGQIEIVNQPLLQYVYTEDIVKSIEWIAQNQDKYESIYNSLISNLKILRNNSLTSQLGTAIERIKEKL